MSRLRKTLKWVGIVFGSLVALLVAALLYVQFAGLPTFPVETVEFKAEATPAHVTRGKAIVSMMCQHCHFDQATGKLTGRYIGELPAEFGEIYSHNITRSPSHGIGSWTDGQLAYFLRTGIRPDGRYVPPYMVKIPRVSDDDLASIIAFLRSDDPLVATDESPNRTSKPSLLAKVLSRVVFKPFPYPKAPIAPVPVSDQVAYGKYIVNDLVQCYTCHSADFKTMDPVVPERSEGYLGGSNPLRDANGKAIYSSNLTSDEETGIGKWTDAEFRHALRDGFAPGNRPLRDPMTRYFELSDAEASAVFAFLRQTKPIKKATPPAEGYTVEPSDDPGRAVYLKYACQGCHGLNGKGSCDLRDAAKKYDSDEKLAAWIRNPAAIVPDTKMPAFDHVIKEEDFPPLTKYVRQLGERHAER